MKKYYFILLTLTVLFLNSCGEKSKSYFRDEGLIFGTTYHIIYEYSKDIHNDIKKELDDFNMSLSTYEKNSVISKVNRNEDVELDNYFIRCFKKAKEVSEKTEGAFDITVAPLVNAWGFGFSKKDSVSKELIDSLICFVGMDKVRLTEGKIEKKYPEIMLDASAIAKGYGVDVVAEYLESKGIENYLVEIGGEIRVNGKNAKGTAWRVGIDKPIDDPEVLHRELQEIIQLSSGALATSGNYRNFYIKDGKKYAHTIDPKTGYPVQHELLSASVYAPDCMTADAYATAFMVLGLDKAKKIVENTPELEAYFIYRGEGTDTLQVFYTEGLGEMIVK
ncbi:MAG: FAD:protein FMN transferase [Chlorobi bacterium]|nr:FAD:protein FMN transferase [Chlorobiota bacterium]